MKTVLFIALTLAVGLAFGQLDKPVIGKPYSTDRKENFNGFIGENATTLFSIDYLYINRKKQELLVRKFHKSDLELMESTNIYEVPADGFYGEPLEVFYRQDTIYLFSNLFDENQRLTYITLELFNVNLEKLDSKTVDTLREDENLFVRESQDQQGFVLARSKKFSNLTEQEIRLTAIGTDGAILWKKILKSPMALQNIRIEELCHIPGGPIFILCNYAYDPAVAIVGDDNTMINNKYAIWAYDREINLLKEFEVRIKGKWINGAEMIINPAGNLVLSGFFNETRYHTIAGTFSLVLDKKLEVLNSALYKFDDAVLSRFIAEKDKGRIKELEDYQLKDLAMLHNGSYFLLGEHYYKYVERNYDPRTNITTTTEHYNYNSIVVSYFDSLGNHQWTDRVPKWQSSTNDFGYFSSFTYLNSGSEVYLFFNDSEKNNELALDDYFNYKELFNNRRFQVTYVRVDTAGPVSRGALVGLENSFMLRAKESDPISESTMYLLGEVGREAKVFSVQVKKN